MESKPLAGKEEVCYYARDYEVLEDYTCAVSSESEFVKKVLKCPLSDAFCHGKCCKKDNFGKFDHDLAHFETACECRKLGNECTDKCGCSVEECGNRSIQKSSELIMDRDVVSLDTYGLGWEERSLMAKCENNLAKAVDVVELSVAEVRPWVEGIPKVPASSPQENNAIKMAVEKSEISDSGVRSVDTEAPQPDIELKDHVGGLSSNTSSGLASQQVSTNAAAAPIGGVPETGVIKEEESGGSPREDGGASIQSPPEAPAITALDLYSMLCHTICHEEEMDSLQAYVYEGSVGSADDRANLYNECRFMLEFVASSGRLRFKLCPKGRGVACLRPEGIAANRYIVKYLGEIYPPWRWFERQDAVKKVVMSAFKKGRLSKADLLSPDFFNITLERDRKDGNHAVLFIDSVSKGSYASRLNHSCSPNCYDVVTKSQGNLSIGVYASRKIHQYEEMCIDYHSTTESYEEFVYASCLCGQSTCRGYFLNWAGSNTYDEIICKKHNFLDRNALLLRACSGEAEYDEQLLAKHGVGSLVLGEPPLPMWLKRWACEIVRYAVMELEVLPNALHRGHKSTAKEDVKLEKEHEQKMASDVEEHIQNAIGSGFVVESMVETQTQRKDSNTGDPGAMSEAGPVPDQKSPSSMDVKTEGDVASPAKDPSEDHEEEVKLTAQGVFENRIHQLVVTLDKIRYFLLNQPTVKHGGSIKDLPPPLRVASVAEVVHAYWNGPDSAINRFWPICQTHLNRSALFGSEAEMVHIVDISRAVEATIQRRYVQDPGDADAEDSSPPAKKARSDKSRRAAIIAATDAGLSELRKRFLEISELLRQLQDREGAVYSAAADGLHLMANTRYFFTSEGSYESVRSPKMRLGRCDIKGLPVSTVPGKSYVKVAYLWGQLMYWYKQTINEPNQSLSQDRRGSLSPCDLECCFAKIKKSGEEVPNPRGLKYIQGRKGTTRDEMLNTVRFRGDTSWPVRWPFSFKNPYKMYGTPWMDVALGVSQKADLVKLVDNLEKM